MVTVLLVDDHPVVRKSLKNDLEDEVDFRVIAEATDGEEAVRLANQFHPDIVIMDIAIPKINGIEATRQIKVINPNTIVLALSVYDDFEHVRGVLEAGADGYLTKNLSVEDIIKSIRATMAGEVILSPQVVSKVVKYTLQNTINPAPKIMVEQLSAREQTILKMLAKGLSNKQIAAELDVSIRTVKSHLETIFLKLSISSRIEAVIVGLRSGLLKLDDLD